MVRGMNACCNPLSIYNMTKKLINKLKSYKLRVIRVYSDALSNPDKLSTYLSRRKSSQSEAIKFWENGLTGKGEIFIFLLS